MGEQIKDYDIHHVAACSCRGHWGRMSGQGQNQGWTFPPREEQDGEVVRTRMRGVHNGR
jgi:hypothetical protein